ncbi:MAG: RNA polymerase sigma factor [Bacteroidota bacterium]|nr:RNA polymerase sigma factor [Bacteroidota bacterium]
MNEIELVAHAKQDPQAFGALYELHFERVFRFVYHRLNEKQTAKDITQQVFVKALLNIHSFQFKGFTFSSWLFRIAINELNRFYGQIKKERCVNIDSEGLKEILMEVNETAYAALDQALFSALKHLTDDQLLIVEMRYFEKRSFAEIGEIMGITENNAKVRLYRVIDKLKVLMKTN